uniref:Uncharacterized protein n=1 Tax=Molossus molossus TaxID=27622 RepID=A0A7J8GRS0_MOLMO|nr:hypothetical protein HJG59_011343 [Molossus molossus]
MTKTVDRSRLNCIVFIISLALCIFHHPSTYGQSIPLSVFTTPSPKFQYLQALCPCLFSSLTIIVKEHRAHSELPQIKLTSNFGCKLVSLCLSFLPFKGKAGFTSSSLQVNFTCILASFPFLGLVH